jgi:uncharacterized membrane protein
MMRLRWITILGLLLILLGAPVAKAQDQQPQNDGGLTLFAQYPVQEVAIGENVSVELKLTTDTPQIARLELQGLPDGWTASFRGGGRVVQAVYAQPEQENKVDLRIEPPADLSAGTYRLTVIARGENGDSRLPLELIVKDKLPPKLTFEVDLPTLRGSSDTTFRFNATLKNEGDEDLDVTLNADAPQGFQVSFKTGGQDVTSFPLGADESKSLSIEARPFAGLPGGTYTFNVLAQAGDVQASTTLNAEVTGQAELNVTASDGRLSGQAYAGRETPITLIVQNTGTAPARNIELTASAPAGWNVTLDPDRIAEIAPDGQQEVTARISPSDQAIAGDYVVNITARPEDGASKSAEFRITVLTSTLWGIVGVGLIAIAVVVAGMAVMRFGRR